MERDEICTYAKVLCDTEITRYYKTTDSLALTDYERGLLKELTAMRYGVEHLDSRIIQEGFSGVISKLME